MKIPVEELVKPMPSRTQWSFAPPEEDVLNADLEEPVISVTVTNPLQLLPPPPPKVASAQPPPSQSAPSKDKLALKQRQAN